MFARGLGWGLALAALVSPVLAQDETRQWTATIGETEAFFAYATPESDDVAVSLSCRRKTGQIKILAPFEQRLAGRARSRPLSVTVVSGTKKPVSATVPGVARPDEMNGGATVETELADRAPVMAEFGRSGRLRLEAAGEAVEPPPAPAGQARRFLRACR
jgi:hypothetical protein